MPAPGEVQALKDVKRVVTEHGQTLKFQISEDKPSDITRDKYRSVRKITGPIFIEKSFPVRYSPSDKLLSKHGITEKVDILVYTSTLLWRENHSLEFDDIYKYLIQVQMPDKRLYQGKHVVTHSHYGDDFLYIVFGLVKN